MLAFLIPVLSLTMGLVRAHATDSPTCAPLVPAEMDNATVHRVRSAEFHPWEPSNPNWGQECICNL